MVAIVKQIDADIYAEDVNQAKRVNWQMDDAQRFLNRNEEKSKDNNKSWANQVLSCMNKYNISYKGAASNGWCGNKYYLSHE